MTAGSQAPSSPPANAPAGPRISVALCTFNGARFLEPQLDSYIAQKRQPDELVVCDDGSTDDTLAILDRFKNRAPFPVSIVRNQERLGSTKNFEKAIGLCAGEFIATSDQDDVWLPDKLADSEACLLRDPRCGLVFSDAEVVDEQLRPVGHRLFEAVHFGRSQRRRARRGEVFEALLRQWLVTGATMMFRAEYRPVLAPIPESWIHDGWIAFIIGALAPLAIVEDPTLQYRQHAAQQIGGKKYSLRELYDKARQLGPSHFRVSLQRFLLAEERLRAFAHRVRDPRFLPMVARKVEHQRRRLAISENPSRAKRVLLALQEFFRGGYSSYSPNLTHLFKDMFF